MPKMKSNRAAKKRFRVTGKGKVLREHAYASHKFTSKSQDRKRKLRKAGQVSSADMPKLKRMIQI
ncbi:MAG: 50S ribosomal protein L35 [Calditrichaeota bacterium]|jgi:large subunit ribosomal protein L35|nr:50S ribosomal protein L35 [Calditrichota bacterium]MBT7618542.1 50S ribosomal protein L35 [Calditrichota bacterium]MBT7787828.1 50S ribosomal protein L35 [Calditrichota bacterium]